jgi:hypothetical protein
MNVHKEQDKSYVNMNNISKIFLKNYSIKKL